MMVCWLCMWSMKTKYQIQQEQQQLQYEVMLKYKTDATYFRHFLKQSRNAVSNNH